MTEITEQSEKIQSIIRVIDSIADQTNLLSQSESLTDMLREYWLKEVL